MKRNDDDARYRYDDEPSEPNVYTKLALFLALILAVYLIYKYTGDRNKAAEEIVSKTEQTEDNDYTKRSVNGDLQLKEKGWFGEVITIPITHELNIEAYTMDAARIEIRLTYQLDKDITVEQLKYYHEHQRDFEHELAVAIKKSLINYGVVDLFESSSPANDIKKKTSEVDRKYNLHTVFTSYTPEPRVADALDKRREAKQQVEKAKADALKIQAEAERQLLIERTKRDIEEAVRRVKEAEKAKRESDKKIKQSAVDSMKQVLQYKLDSAQAASLSSSLGKVPEVIIVSGNDGPTVLDAYSSLLKPKKSQTMLTIEKTIEYLKAQAQKLKS